jgi:hypothetical protein
VHVSSGEEHRGSGFVSLKQGLHNQKIVVVAIVKSDDGRISRKGFASNRGINLREGQDRTAAIQDLKLFFEVTRPHRKRLRIGRNVAHAVIGEN